MKKNISIILSILTVLTIALFYFNALTIKEMDIELHTPGVTGDEFHESDESKIKIYIDEVN